MSRAEQREQTRAQIIDGAVAVFAEQGFDGASTRAIATRAGVTQGLTTYHFPTKEELWRAAADRVFGWLSEALDPRDVRRQDDADRGRAMLANYVRANAEHPEIFHFMVDAGRHDDDRMHWLVDQHLQPRFDQVAALLGVANPPETASVYYAIVGAASLIFAIAPECERLTGVDPSQTAAIDAHVELLARLFTPAT